MTFIEFMTKQIGPKWVVVSRRTKNMQLLYPGRKLLTRIQYNNLAKLYKIQTGRHHYRLELTE